MRPWDNVGMPEQARLADDPHPARGDGQRGREPAHVRPVGRREERLLLDGATVHAIDVASGADRALASSFQAGSLATRCDAACVVF
jgi:hypothetical protein